MKDILVSIVIFLIGILLYAATLRAVPGNPTGNMVKNNLDQATKPLELSPERGRYLLVMSLAENGSFSLNQTLADAAYPDIGWYQGKFYIFFAPGISVLALPMYLVGKPYGLAQAASFFTISIISAITLIFLYKISRDIFKLPVWASLLSPLIFGFASTSWSYAITLYQHHVTTFCIISSIYAAWKYKNGNAWSWIWAAFIWLNLSVAIAIDYPNVILMAPVMLYFLHSSFKISKNEGNYTAKWRLSYIATSIIFVCYVFVQAYFNYTHFGGVTRVSNTIASYKAIIENKTLKNVDTEEANRAADNDRSASGFFNEYAIPTGFTILTLGLDRGIFLYSPIYILALFGIWIAVKKMNAEIAALLGVTFANFFLYSSWGDPWGGWAFGPRYLIPSMATLSIFVGLWVSRNKFMFFRRTGAFVLIAYSTAVALLGALTTNAVPPKVEADFLKSKYNFLMNLDFMLHNRSGSFIYNTNFADHISVSEYFFMIFTFIMSVTYIVLFLIPFIKSIKNPNT